MALQVYYRYKQTNSDLQKRKAEGTKVLKKFPAKIPLVLGLANRSELPEMEKCKFLFPANAKVGDLIQFINTKLNRAEHAPLFIYADNEIVVSPSSMMSELYQEYREDDFFLYLAYYEENIHHHRHGHSYNPDKTTSSAAS